MALLAVVLKKKEQEQQKEKDKKEDIEQEAVMINTDESHFLGMVSPRATKKEKKRYQS